MSSLREWAEDRVPLIAAATFLVVAVAILIVVSLLRGH